MVNETKEVQASLEELRTVLNIVRYENIRSPKRIIQIAVKRGLSEQQAKAALKRIIEDMQ